MKILNSGLAPLAAAVGYKLVSTLHSTETELRARHASEDLVFVCGAPVFGQADDVYEFARFERVQPHSPDLTPKEIKDRMKARGAPTIEVEWLYAVRDEYIERLKAAGIVTLQNVRELERSGKGKVANELWAQCTKEAKAALLHDEHHQVRSCASIANQEASFDTKNGGVR